MKTKIYIILFFTILTLNVYSVTNNYISDGYLKAVEMNIGDTLLYHLKNGQIRNFILKETSATPLFIYKNPDIKSEQSGIVYKMNCVINADGKDIELQRIVSAQQSYYEPWHINGVTLFFDAVKVIDNFIHDNHGSTGGEAYPKKDARFAFIEYQDNFSSQDLKPWYPNTQNFISIKDAYQGGDTWLGGYRKDVAHNGIDINIPNNTPLWAPIDFDNQYYFNSLEKGDNNNRWLGVRDWPNGEKWILRTHHMTELKVKQNIPIKQGEFYGTAGGVLTGGYPHIHFYFIWENKNLKTALDPWILFWKIFENNKKNSNQIYAIMNQLSPTNVGNKITLNAENSKKGVYGNELSYFWSISDGTFYEGKTASHIFQKEGIYVVNLVITDGADTATTSQCITVNQGTKPDNYLSLFTIDPLDFRTKTPEVTEIYGKENKITGNTLHFFFQKNADYSPLEKYIILDGSKSVLESINIQVDYLNYSNWLQIEKIDNKIKVSVIKENLSNELGKYIAKVNLKSEITGIHQRFYVEATAPYSKFKPKDKIIVDDKQVKLYPSNLYWIELPYDREYLKGYESVTFWSSSDKYNGIARFQPILTEGKYKIYLHENAIYEPKYTEIKSGIIHVQIKTVNTIKDIYWDPSKTDTIGTFELFGGENSYVDFLTKGSSGQLYLDALVFEKITE